MFAALIFLIFPLMSYGNEVDIVNIRADFKRIPNEIQQLDNYAVKRELTLREWKDFVSSVDQKCDDEKDAHIKVAYCSFYYHIDSVEKLIERRKDNSESITCRNIEDAVAVTSNNPNIKSKVNMVIKILCKK